MTTTTKLGLTALAVALSFATAAAADGQRTPILAMEDWPLDAVISIGKVYCPGGEIVVDPILGLPRCTPGSRTHLRDGVYYSCVHGFTFDGAPEPRFSGVMYGEMGANWDPEYTGAVWGSWLLVPAESCDQSVLEDPETYWVGRWQGQRTRICDGDQCVWIGNLNFVGRGRGELDGLHFRGTELILTYTPSPMAYELIAALGLCQPGSCPTGPEGHFTGTIR